MLTTTGWSTALLYINRPARAPLQLTDSNKASKVKIRHMPPFSFRVWGKWGVTDTPASISGHGHQTQTLLGL